MRNTPSPSYSFEIFPPKGHVELDSIFKTIDELATLQPDLISVTYGAGGTSRENTVEIASKIQNSYENIEAVAHLTCVGATKKSLDEILNKLRQNGVKNILALRGDLVEGEPLGEFKYASDLISYIKKNYDFKIFAACYPEKHPEAINLETDIENLKRKVDLGADELITQLFFDNETFLRFRDKLCAAGIKVPIETGIMPITSATQVTRMVNMCGASLPPVIQKKLDSFGHDSVAMKEAGILYAIEQISDLLTADVDGIHLYTMNQPDIAKRITESIQGILSSKRAKRV